jgi:hypothetical protein
MFGLYKASLTGNLTYLGVDANGWGYYFDGEKWTNSTGSAYGSSYTTNDVIGVAFDADAGSLYFYKNGAVQNSGTAAFTGLTSGPYVFATGTNDAGTRTAVSNFGQRAFAYTAPSGFKALVDTNLPAPVVAKPNTVFDVALWTGNGAARSITGLGFSPDLVWIKARSTSSYRNALFDAVRGANNRLISDLTNAEDTGAGIGVVSAFNSNGFSLDGGGGTVNETSQTYVAWTWDAGTSTVTNTAGSITSQVRANASAGFSVVTAGAGGYFGGSVGHGLGVAPEFIILKDRNGTSGWRIYHKSLGNNFSLQFTSGAANDYGSNLWAVSPTVFGTNQSLSNTAVAYCFAPVSGYSSFGSYTGNGSADGPFVYTGFRPRWIMLKNASSSGGGGNHWLIWDSLRNTYNVTNTVLFPNLSNADTTASTVDIDILSNGFKIKAINSATNGSAESLIYACFAENPFQYARAR